MFRFILAASIVLLAAGASAAPDRTRSSIIVTLDSNYPPYCFLDSAGEPSGILPDQWRLWEARTGVSVRLLALDWALAKEAMAAGRADVIDTIFFNPERAKTYDFTPPYVDIDVPIFFQRNLSGFGTVESLRGFTVGVKEGDAAVDVLRSKGVDSLKYYTNYESIVEAAMAGDIHVFCVDRPPALYYLYKHGAQGEFRTSISLYTGRFHRAVAKGDAALLGLVQGGFAKIAKAEYDAIDRRWLGLGLEMTDFLRNAVYLVFAAALVAVAFVVWSLALRRQVHRRTAELSAAKAEAERASLVKGRFLSNMSHEIRTPLNGIVGMTSLLASTPLSEEQARYLELMRSSTALLLGIVNDILDLAKIESGTRPLRIETEDPGAVVATVVRSFEHLARERGLALSFAREPERLPAALIDGTALSQIAMNLVGNALKFTERGSVSVRLSMRERERGGVELVLEVEDTGIGIAADRLEEIFDRFTQIEDHPAKRRGGTGLGLAIVRELATLMGGSVAARSEPGLGSTFTVRLPIAIAPDAGLAGGAAAETAAETAAAAVEPERPDGRAAEGSFPAPGGPPTERVLVVEDNMINLLYLKTLLERAGYSVASATNGRDAVRLASTAEAGFACILMDIQMPEMDGIEALERIRALGPPGSSVPAIALTGYAMEEDRRRLLGCGFAAVVTKPINEPLLFGILSGQGRPGGAG